MKETHITKDQHETNTLSLAREAAKTLADSPISRREQLACIKGFYLGYCSGREYEVDWKVCAEITDLY
jgi:hypothetical protein